MSTDRHHHDHDPHDEIPFDEKLTKLFSHWIKHNDDHALNYRNWAEKAKANGKSQIACLLEEAADMSLKINAKFEMALAAMNEE